MIKPSTIRFTYLSRDPIVDDIVIFESTKNIKILGIVYYTDNGYATVHTDTTSYDLPYTDLKVIKTKKVIPDIKIGAKIVRIKDNGNNTVKISHIVKCTGVDNNSKRVKFGNGASNRFEHFREIVEAPYISFGGL